MTMPTRPLHPAGFVLSLMLPTLGVACGRNVLHTGTVVPGNSATSPAPVPLPVHSDGSCDPGRNRCSSGGEELCVDLQASPNHCGDCGVACAPGVPCEAGQCRIVPCTEQLTMKLLRLGDSVGGQTALGDFDRDGTLDLLLLAGSEILQQAGVPYSAGQHVVVLHGHGDGTFTPGKLYPAAPSAQNGVALAAADLNRDRILDMVVGSAGGTATSPENMITMVARLGIGDGSFGPEIGVFGGAVPDFVALADLDGDGVPDLASVSGPKPVVTVRNGNGDGSFGAPRDLPVGGIPSTVTVVDWNGDGIPDLLATDAYVHLLFGTGHGSFAPALDCALGMVAPMGVPGRSPPVLGDFDHDRRVDLVSNNSLLLGMQDCNFGRLTSYRVPYGASYPLAAGDFNGDGKTDLAIAYLDGIGFLAGDGRGNLGALVKLGGMDGEHGTADTIRGLAADFNSDGRLDLLIHQTSIRTFMNTCK